MLYCRIIFMIGLIVLGTVGCQLDDHSGSPFYITGNKYNGNDFAEDGQPTPWHDLFTFTYTANHGSYKIGVQDTIAGVDDSAFVVIIPSYIPTNQVEHTIVVTCTTGLDSQAWHNTLAPPDSAEGDTFIFRTNRLYSTPFGVKYSASAEGYEQNSAEWLFNTRVFIRRQAPSSGQ